MLKRIFLLRRLLLCAGIFSGLLVFWLPAHEVFEGPKSAGFLIYSCLLLALSFPLFLRPVPWPGLRPWLLVSGSLLGATVLSFVGAYSVLPANVLLCVEKLAPMLAGAMAALVFVLETPETRRRALFSLLCSHALMIFYGLVQVIDQTLGQSAHLVIDLIRWTSFGESRVYSTLGNPDYMAAHITLFLPLWLALPWRDPALKLRPALCAAALALALLPLLVLLFTYGFNLNLWGAVMKAYPLWALCAALLYFASRNLGLRTLWIGFAYLMALLVVVAQGRAAYAGLAVSAAVSLFLAARLGGKDFFVRRASFFRINLMAMAAAGMLLAGIYGLRASSPQNGLLKIMPIQSTLRVSDALFSRLSDFFAESSDATNVRRFYFKSAIRMGLDHPLFGVGFGNHALFTARAQSSIWKDWEKEGNKTVMYVEPHVELYTHNDFLQNFAETGLIGLAAFCIFWFFLVSKSWQLAQRGWADTRGRLGIGMLGLTAAFMTSAMLNFPWRVLATQQLCWLAFAMLAVASLEASPAQTAPPVPARWPRSPLALGMAVVLAFILALWPARWFFASTLFKQGNLGRDQQRHADGAKFYQKAVDAGLSGTQRVELYLYLGSMHNMLSRPDLAEQWFNNGVKIYPDFIEAHYNLGYTSMLRYNSSHLEADRLKAIESFNRVLDINPRYVNALNNIGNLYYAVRDFVNAAEAYEKVIRFAPNTLEARYNLGVTYLMMQKRPEGEKQLAEALRIKPDYEQARQIYEQLKKLPPGTQLQFK